MISTNSTAKFKLLIKEYCTYYIVTTVKIIVSKKLTNDIYTFITDFLCT